MLMKVMLIPFVLFFLLEAAEAFPVVNEIMYNPTQTQGEDSALEWVELYAHEDVDLS